MQNRIVFMLIIGLFIYVGSTAQSLAVNTDGSTANTSALLDVKSATKGLLIPRMSKTQKNSIASPATGLLIFQNAPDSVGFHYYDGSSWIWLANSTGDQWLINGNNNITASNYIGTNTNNDLNFAANSIVRTRLVSSSGFWGFGESNPQYDLDASLGTAAVVPCIRNGLRLKPAGATNDCDNGLFVGLDDNNSITNASVWNYGANSTGAQNLRFGLNSLEIMRLNAAGFQGLGESNPQYTFDMKLGTAAIFPCTRNGIRMNVTSNNNDCDRGLFVGYDDNSFVNTASLWNFGDGSAFPTGYVFRFGMGSNFTFGEKMRITGNAVGIGNTNPLAKLHITDPTGSTLPGVMITNVSLPSSSNGFYAGLKTNATNIGRLWNYQNADVEIGTNDVQRMLVTAAGNVGIGTGSAPASTLEVDGTIAVGVSMAIGGGTIGLPTLLSLYKSYAGLSPAGGNNYYLLPNAATCTGRVYYLRNNSNTDVAHVGAGGSSLICPGSGACLASGSYYDLNAGVSVKTIIAISDGINWTVGKID